MSSTTTTSERPRAFNARTTLLPMKPAPPVTTIMARRPKLARGTFDETVCGAAVRALRLARGLDREVDLRMGVPEVHARQRAVQRQVGARHLVDLVGVRRLQMLLDPTVTFTHRSNSSISGAESYSGRRR